MKSELVLELKKDFPNMFRGELYIEMSAGDGWYDLVKRLCAEITALDPEGNCKILQVKEKFGGLRFYASGTNKEIGKLIGEAESDSFRICEGCGTRENVTVGGKNWIRALCNTCRG